MNPGNGLLQQFVGAAVREVSRQGVREAFRYVRSGDWRGLRPRAAEFGQTYPRLPESRNPPRQELSRAYQAMVEAQDAWKAHGYAMVPATTMAAQSAIVQNLKARVHGSRIAASQKRDERRQLLDEMARRSQRRDLFTFAMSPLFPIVSGAGAFPVGVVLGLAVSTFATAITGFLSALAFCVCALVFCALILMLRDSFVREVRRQSIALEILKKEITDVDTQLFALTTELGVAEDDLAVALRQRERHKTLAYCAAEYQQAYTRYTRLWQFFQSQPYRLLNCGWRGLRDHEFVSFLKQVFETLGYAVQVNPRHSRDQGVDLFAIGKGRKIAIQAKGWPSGRLVGSPEVRESFGGAHYYGYDECVVITNSHFSVDAERYAQVVRQCRLINRDRISDLIVGKCGY